MPLSIPLPAGAKVIINGAVIENSGSSNISLTVHNKANILRDKDVLTQVEADTPAKEIYHSIQNAYLFEANRGEWLAVSALLMEQFERLVPAATDILTHVRELIVEDKLYNALRASRRLIALEAGEAPESVTHPGEAHVEKGAGAGQRQKEIGRIKGKIAELERRIAAIDSND
ncbi:MAG TPA: flagellar biosynthesis repressor FlbT [Aliidongia sp.]|nr:flagellar biosynthesis repressor FlbT [Aliidongia sp.]